MLTSRKVSNKLLKLLGCSSILLCLIGCNGIGPKNNNTNYAAAKELPPLKFPADAAPVSKKYDIPVVPNNNGKIITTPLPPDF